MNLTIKTKIEINASQESVWNLIANLSKYSDWNPFVINASGEAKLGAKIFCQPKLPNGGTYKFKPAVTRCRSFKEFAWCGVVIHSIVASGEHVFVFRED